MKDLVADAGVLDCTGIHPRLLHAVRVEES